MSADAPVVSTVEHGGFTLTGTGAAEAVEAIKADEKAKRVAKGEPEESEKPKGKEAVKQAASALGKLGGKAAAEKRAATAEKEEAKPANTEKEAATEEPEKPKATAEDDDDSESLDKYPRAKARVEQKAREAKEAREEARKERETRIRLEERLQALERTSKPSDADKPGRAEFHEETSDEPKLDTYLQKHGEGGEAKAISEWVSDRDKWRDGQQAERQAARQYAERIGKAETTLRESVKKVIAGNKDFWAKVQPIAAEAVPVHNLDLNTVRPTGVNFLADEFHLDPENAPRVMEYLADNRDDYEIIKGYHSPRAVTRAVALIVAHLDRATAGEPQSSERPASKPESSKAPPPVRPVTGAPSTASGADPAPRPGEDFDDWNRRTNGKRTAAR